MRENSVVVTPLYSCLPRPQSALIVSITCIRARDPLADRLNVFGFLGSTELANASHDGSTGNYGLQDQRMAMEWVQKNIHAFGGDKKRVMIFGESAGAGSVAAHTVMPKSIGEQTNGQPSPRLFSRAVLESGGYSVWDAHGLNTSQQTFSQLAGLLCPSSSNETLLRCLREKDTATVALMAQLLPKPCNAEFCCKWAPTVDGVELPEHPFALASQPRSHSTGVAHTGLSILLGTNLDEDASFVGQNAGPLYWNMTESDFAKFAKGLYNFSATQIKELKSLCKWGYAMHHHMTCTKATVLWMLRVPLPCIQQPHNPSRSG